MVGGSLGAFRSDAWKAYFRGDYLRAGDLYKAEGKLEKALQMYLKGHDLLAAAKVEEELGESAKAVDLYLRGGDKESAIRLLCALKAFGRASQICAEAGDFARAASLAEKAGNFVLAAGYWEQSGHFWEGAVLLRRSGQYGKAMLLMERALRQFPSESVLSHEEAEGWRAKKAQAAGLFEEGQSPERAGELYEEIGDWPNAARCWELARQFSKALALYERAGNREKVAELIEQGHETPAFMRARSLADHGDRERAAELLLSEGKKQEAADLLEQTGNAAAAAPIYEELEDWERAGNLYFKTGEYRKAGDCFRCGYQFAMASQSYYKAGDKPLAVGMALEAGLWEQALEMAGSDESLLNELIRRLQVASPQPDDPYRALLVMARAFLEIRQPDVVIELLEGPSAPRPGTSLMADYLHGRALEVLGRVDEAEKEYKRVTARDMGFMDAAKRLKELPSRAHANQGSRYVPQSLLFADASGELWDGEDTRLGVKALLHRISLAGGNPGMIKRYAESVKALIGLSHPAILQVRDVQEETRGVMVVCEPFASESLEARIEKGWAPSLFETLDVTRQVLEALEEAHRRKVIHRQLSPQSVLIDQGLRVKVRGFGTARRLSEIPESPAKEALLPYLSPEVLVGENQSAASDLYAVGAMVYRMLLGSPPKWSGDGGGASTSGRFPLLRSASVPELLKNIVARLMAPEPSERYQEASQVLRDLRGLELAPGAVVAGRYEIIEELGRGGMGQVFRVRDRELDEVVALKTLKPRSDLSQVARNRFLLEIKLSRKITHPNVVRVFDLGTWRDLTFLTMEYIPGPTLSRWLREGAGAKASLGEKIVILRGVAAGLAEAHRLGIIHRDLKPQNVILTPQGVPKVVDFGIAYVQRGAELTQDGHFVGSPKYVSPEQVQGLKLDARSDIYSFGLLAYFLFTGEDAFTGDNPTLILMAQLRDTPPNLCEKIRAPQSLGNLVAKCLSKSPDDRPASLREVLRSLEEIR
jgi:serine/threonine protein kinase